MRMTLLSPISSGPLNSRIYFSASVSVNVFPLTPPPCLIPPWSLHWNHQRKLNRNAPQCLHQQMKPKRRLKKRKKFARVQLKPGGATWRWSFSQFNPTLAAGLSHGNLKPTESIFYILIIYSTCCWEEIFT